PPSRSRRLSFFQAEDGIRAFHVTGVQTCALPILPQADPELRATIDRDAERLGWPALHARLAALDPDAAAALEPTDAQRIQRALEIVQLTGRPLAESYARREDGAIRHRLLTLALVPS